MTQCERHGPHTARLHDSGVSAVPADADHGVDGGPAWIGLQARRRSLGARGGDDLSADRRACRLAQKIFLDVLKRDAAILPRIVPIGDVDEDELAFAEAAIGETGGTALDLPDAIEGLERKVLLAQLILKWAATPEMRGDRNLSLVANSPAGALALAGDLARLMDDMVTRQVSWDRLDGLVPTDMDEFWQKTLRFLKIAREYWPAILKEKGRIEPAERRDTLIAAEAKRLETSAGPVIAAGSTGSIPATATLLATIAKLPHGALVLPGLDTDLDEATWKMIASHDADSDAAHGHPQFAMSALLQKIGIVREGVIALAPPEPHGRERLASEALRPAAASELWQERLADAGFAIHADAALGSVAVIEAANAEEEALAIAVALREAVDDPGKSAALVTPDRALARRVLAAMARWNVPVDDSGGDALSDTPAGVFARLAAEAALDGLAPVTLLALLKHPSCKFDAAAVSTLERAILRGPRPKRGTAGLEHALQTFRQELEKLRGKVPSSLHRTDPRAWLTNTELDAPPASSPASRRRSSRWNPCRRVPAVPRPCRAASHDAGRAWRHHRGTGERIRRDRSGRQSADRAERLHRAVPRRDRRPESPPARDRCAGAHLRPARSAPAAGRPPGAGRAGRGRLAARDARRSLAQPADAPRARPRPARAAHRPLGARLRAGARRARGDPHPRGQARRRADGRLALLAEARRRRGRDALERRNRARRAVCGAGPQARRDHQDQSGDAA